MVTVVASLEALLSDAETVVEAPSTKVLLVSDSDTVGAVSSSSNVNVAPVTVVTTPWEFCAVPVTVVVRFGSSMVLLTAVMVAVSLLFEVLPADMVMVASEPTV